MDAEKRMVVSRYGAGKDPIPSWEQVKQSATSALFCLSVTILPWIHRYTCDKSSLDGAPPVGLEAELPSCCWYTESHWPITLELDLLGDLDKEVDFCESCDLLPCW